MNIQPPITDEELNAYLDGELPTQRRLEVEALLAEYPELAATLNAYRQQDQGIKALFNPVLNEEIPVRFTRATSATTRFRAWPLSSLQRIAASVLLVVASGSAGWLARGAWTPDTPSHDIAAIDNTLATLPHQAAIAHVVYSPDMKRPVEISAEHEDQLITWLSKRLNANVRPPSLGMLGYDLIGGRLLPGASGPVAQFMYNDAAGRRVTLYVSTDNPRNQETAFRFAQEGPVNVFYWIDGKFGYALSADMDKAELAKLATAVYGQLASAH
ncbi:MAG TPA: anti-sigma factor [Rhodocyclaceae bacterium]|nr:anti-sigma factor [Rhodocyclaceae bacterium]